MKNDNQSIDFIKKCRSIDFSSESVNKERNLNILKNKIKNTENKKELNMNKKFKKPTAIIAAVSALLCLSMVVYGQGLIRIIKTVTLGNHASFSVIEDNLVVIPLPDELKGLVYDKDGNELQTVPQDRTYYNENGEKAIPVIENNMFKISTEEEYNELRSEDNYVTYKDLEEGKKIFVCDTLSPTYLPEGYVFDRMAYYLDPKSQEAPEPGSQKYINIYYSNGKNEMYSQVRFMDEETGFEADATKNIQETKINGHDAIIDGNVLHIQIGDVMYMFFCNEDITSDELIKIAESLK